MRVFIGSPFKGLQDVRRVLRDALSSDYEILWMEDFGSQEVSALDACLRHVEDANVYLLIFGATYGTVLPGSDYSYTQLEYEHAERTGTPVLAYVQKLSSGETRDAPSVDFLNQVRKSQLVEYSEFATEEELVAFVRRDLHRLEARLMRPKFPDAAPIADEQAYSLGRVRRRVLQAAPYTVTLVDAGAVSDPSYRAEKRGRLGDKVESIRRVTAGGGALVQVFNDFPIKRKGDLAKLRAARVNANARLIVILIAKESSASVTELFEDAGGERAVFYGDWIVLDNTSDYSEKFSSADLNSCELRAAVLDLIEARLDRHVTEQLG